MTPPGAGGPAPTTGAVFDMDGLLVDSEPVWREVHQEVFAELGIDVTVGVRPVTTGMRVDEVVAMRRGRRDWGPPADAEVVNRIVSRVAARVVDRAHLMPGAIEAIDWCRERGMALALATGSTWPVLEALIERHDLDRHLDVFVSAEDEPFGKPHPAVFLTAAARINVPPAECLAFEDSINGVVAARAARMRTVMVPGGTSLGDPRVIIADVVLDSLLEIDDGRVAALAGL